MDNIDNEAITHTVSPPHGNVVVVSSEHFKNTANTNTSNSTTSTLDTDADADAEDTAKHRHCVSLPLYYDQVSFDCLFFYPRFRPSFFFSSPSNPHTQLFHHCERWWDDKIKSNKIKFNSNQSSEMIYNRFNCLPKIHNKSQFGFKWKHFIRSWTVIREHSLSRLPSAQRVYQFRYI